MGGGGGWGWVDGDHTFCISHICILLHLCLTVILVKTKKEKGDAMCVKYSSSLDLLVVDTCARLWPCTKCFI